MTLRGKLLASFVSMALLVLLIFGVVAYRIALDSAFTRETTLLEDIAHSNAAALARAEGSSGPSVKLPVNTDAHNKRSDLLMFLMPPQGQGSFTPLGHSHEKNFDLTSILQAMATGSKSGRLSTQNGYFAWASASVPGTGNSLLLIHASTEKDQPLFQTLGVRLLVTAAVVIWVSVWGALLISATIARRLNQKQMLLVEANSKLKQEMADRERAEESARAALIEKLRAEASNQAKGHFLSHMSHELRTPLNVIMGYSQILESSLEQSGNAESISDVKNIRAAGNHLLSLTNELLDLSRIEAGKMRFNLEAVDVATLLEELSISATPLVAKNNNRFSLKIPAAPGSMLADATKLRQILLNLLSNACKFTENGEITLKVERLPHDGQGFLAFQLSDTGIGMDTATMKQLFEPFMQSGASAKHNGAGLGLTITKRLCEVVGGSIQCESKPDKGTTFTVRLPLEWRCVNDSAAPAEAATAPLVTQQNVANAA